MLRSVTFRSVMIAIACAISISANAMADTPRKVDVPAGDLATALQKLVEQSGVEFIYSVDQIKGIHTGGVHGEYTAEKAVTKLLEGTNLKITVHKSGAILIAAPNSNTLSNESGSAVMGDRTGAESASNSPPADRLQLAQSRPGSNPQDASMSMDAQASAKRLESKDELEEIIVTGSRLRTTQAATASPVTVITQDEIKKMGFNTVEDVIRSLPQNYGSLNSGTTRDPFSPYSQDSQGQSAADLRGLGPANTLVLVNGRRRAVSSTFGDVVNLNTIPIGSIDRIEIITDGASAVYGSDAVAGVINFILKKDYQGGETHVRQELGANGGDAVALEQTLGDSWNSGNVTFSGRFAKSDSVNSSRIGYTTDNFSSRGGDDWRNPFVAQPGLVQGLGALPPGDNGTNGIAGKLSPANVVPFNDAANVSDFLAGQKHYSIDINAEQNLTDWVRAYGEFSYGKNTSQATNGADHAAYFSTVPATNRFNDLGQPVTVGYVFLNEVQQGLLPAQQTTSDQRALGGVLGVKITLPKDWTLDISGNHSREDASFNSLRIDQTILAERLSGFDANGNPIPANQQLNLFGNGTAQNPAALAGLMRWGIPGFYINDNFSTSDSGLLTAEGSLLKLPGGDMRLAAGGEFRREELSYTDAGHASNLLIASPSRIVKAAFGELNVPVVGEHNRIPGIYSLNLYGAGRWEQYSIKGPFDGAGTPDREVTFSQTSPKVGFSWYPWQELKVRGTFSKSFRAPQLGDLFATTSGPYNFLPIVDPKNPGQGTILPDAYFTGNPNLGPETANNYTGGLDWKPKGTLSGLAVTLTYSRIDFANRIASAFDYYGTPIFYTLPGVIVRDASGNIVRVNIGPVNIASRRSESADALVSYGMDTRAGQLTFGVSGTYVIKLEDSAGPGIPSVVLDGTQTGPERVKARAWTSWSRRNYGLNLYANYSSSYTNTNINSPSLLAPQLVDHYTTFDLNGFYNLPGGFSINAGARNLTNAAFPFYNSRVPWDSRRVDLRGRILYLEFASKYKL